MHTLLCVAIRWTPIFVSCECRVATHVLYIVSFCVLFRIATVKPVNVEFMPTNKLKIIVVEICFQCNFSLLLFIRCLVTEAGFYRRENKLEICVSGKHRKIILFYIYGSLKCILGNFFLALVFHSNRISASFDAEFSSNDSFRFSHRRKSLVLIPKIRFFAISSIRLNQIFEENFIAFS